MRIDKQRAESLRLQGMTLAQVSSVMGCSIDWCKRNLKNIPKNPDTNTLDNSIVNAAAIIGQSNTGITSGEIKRLIIDHYPDITAKKLSDKLQHITRTLLRKHPDTLIRPYWIDSENAQACVDTMMEYSNDIRQYIDDMVLRYLDNTGLDSTHKQSVFYAMIALSTGHKALLPQGFTGKGEQLSRVVKVLEGRN